MRFSSSFCRTQEAHERRRAATTPLRNVQEVAEAAAIVWGRKAAAAELRERKPDHSSVAQPGVPPADPVEDRDRWFSENPDRGKADGIRSM